jgi:hypothetical protein
LVRRECRVRVRVRASVRVRVRVWVRVRVRVKVKMRVNVRVCLPCHGFGVLLPCGRMKLFIGTRLRG